MNLQIAKPIDVALDVDDVLYRSSEMEYHLKREFLAEEYEKLRSAETVEEKMHYSIRISELSNRVPYNYLDPRWINIEAITKLLECQLLSPQLRYSIVTARGSCWEAAISDMFRSVDFDIPPNRVYGSKTNKVNFCKKMQFATLLDDFPKTIYRFKWCDIEPIMVATEPRSEFRWQARNYDGVVLWSWADLDIALSRVL